VEYCHLHSNQNHTCISSLANACRPKVRERNIQEIYQDIESEEHIDKISSAIIVINITIFRCSGYNDFQFSF